MNSQAQQAEIVIGSLAEDEAHCRAEVVAGLYHAVFSLSPLDGDEAEFANQRSITRR